MATDNPVTPDPQAAALAALERVYAAASGGDVYPLLVELVRGLMEKLKLQTDAGYCDAQWLTEEGGEPKCGWQLTAEATEATLSALREWVAVKDAALKRIEPYADLDDLPIIKAALCDAGPSTDWPSIVRQLLSYCRSILNDYPDKSPDSPLGILVREAEDKLAAADPPASPDAKVPE